MAIPWLVVLKAVPWDQVISNAPKVADGAKKLWNSVSGKPPAPPPAVARPDATLSDPESVATLQERLAALEISTDALHEQMLASSELIKTLADQNTQLVRRVEEHRVRLAWLSGIAAVFAIVAFISLAVALSG